MAPAPANDEDSTMATVVRPALPRYLLRGISGAGFGRAFPLVGPTILGRAPDCGIRLDHPGVSRHHARLTPTAEGLLVEDLGSTNGWLLNDVRSERDWAKHGDEIGIDVLRFRVVGTAEPVAPRAGAPAMRSGTNTAARRAPAQGAWWVAVIVVLAVAAAVLLRG